MLTTFEVKFYQTGTNQMTQHMEDEVAAIQTK